MLLCWALRAVTLAEGKRAVIFSIPDPSSALFFACLASSRGIKEKGSFSQAAPPFPSCTQGMQCNAQKLSLSLVFLPFPLQHYLSPFGKPFGPFPHILAQDYDRSLWSGCYSVWLHDPALLMHPTWSPFPSLDKDPWLLSVKTGFLLNMETFKCLGSTIGINFCIRCLLIPKKKNCFIHDRSHHWTTTEVGSYTACG